MANWLTRLLGSSQPRNLEDIRASSDHFELVPANAENPAHLIAYGQITGIEPNINMEVKTAIVSLDNGVEFSTCVGQVTNHPLSLAISDVLNHHFNGKFINFHNEPQSSTDIVYVTQQQINSLTLDSVNMELENHAAVKAIISPVLTDAEKLAQPYNFQSIDSVAKAVVENNLIERIENFQNRYVPIPFVPPTDDDNK